MVRFRLRFLLQEIDVHPGETLIGRSPSCQVTLDDPLVSRRHARILVQDDRAIVEDLRSRNGLHVRGRRVKEPTELNDGDRIRIGTQDLILIKAEERKRKPSGSAMRSTGFMCHCAACGVPYPRESMECPSCGATERMEDETVSKADSQRSWSLDLLAQVVSKALVMRRYDDATRMLERARTNIEQHVASGRHTESEVFANLSDAALTIALQQAHREWAEWSLRIHTATRTLPPQGAREKLARLPRPELALLYDSAVGLLESLRDAQRAPEDVATARAIVAMAAEAAQQ